MSGIAGLTVDGTAYYYGKDGLGNITKILNSSKQVIGEYSYDAWGNTSITKDTNGIATLNKRGRGCLLK